MEKNSEESDNPNFEQEKAESQALSGKEILDFLKFDQPQSILDLATRDFSQTFDFTDTKDRPITVKEWPSGKFIWMRAYDTSRVEVPNTPNPGQAGLLNLADETDANGQNKLRIGDINVPNGYRGAGIADQMLEIAKEFGKKRGASQLYGVIENQQALEFWEHMQKHGWKIDREKGAYGCAYFDLSDGENLQAEKGYFQSRIEKHLLKSTIDKQDDIPLAKATAEQPLKNVEPQIVGDNQHPFLTDRVKKVLVGVSILATLTSTGIAMENYRKSHSDLSSSTNEIVIDKPAQQDSFGALISNKTPEYHLAEHHPMEATSSASTDNQATPAAEIVESTPLTENKQTQIITKPDNATYWYNVPEIRQPDGRSCTPTSVSIVLGYWNAVDSKYPTRSATDLYKENVDEGKFSASGMVITDLDDEIETLNYQSKTISDGDRQELEAELAKGPVITLVRYSNGEISSRGVGHAVVVSGITSDGQVKVTDPMPGKSRLYSWSQFDSAWGTNWGTGATRYLTTVRPAELAD